MVRLEQNAPNPFRGGSNIGYSLPAAGRVVLRVVDVSGRVVATPVDRFMAAGDHTVSVSGAGLAAGCYFYQLAVGGDVQSRRMVVVR